MSKLNSSELFEMFIFHLRIKKNHYEKIHKQFIKDRAGPTIQFSRGIIEGVNEALQEAENLMYPQPE